MSSGFLITMFMPVCMIIFGIWELVQLARKKPTMSQYIVRKIRGGSEEWEIFAWVFALFVGCLGFFLVLHWELPCLSLGLLCDLSSKL